MNKGSIVEAVLQRSDTLLGRFAKNRYINYLLYFFTLQTDRQSIRGYFYNEMRYINLRFTYLLTPCVRCIDDSIRRCQINAGIICTVMTEQGLQKHTSVSITETFLNSSESHTVDHY